VEAENNGTKRSVEIPISDSVPLERIFGYAPLPAILDEVAPGTPAERAGLKEGDIIRGVEGKTVD
jgi:regulator of sigma E protease